MPTSATGPRTQHALIALRSFAALLGLAVGSVRGSAQPTPTAYRLLGTVSASDGHVVSGADVSILNRDTVMRFTRSDTAGRFVFEGLTAPAMTLRVRRVGFEPQLLSVSVTKSGHTASIAVTLEPSVASLEPVLVEDTVKRPEPNPRLVAFNQRRATNSLGHYITPEMLAELRPQHVSEALRNVPGVTLRPSGTIGNLVRLRGCGGRGGLKERGGPMIWLDGQRVTGAEIDDVVRGPDVAGIEVYTSLTGVPAQFFDRTAVCGTIVVWTKHR